MLIRQRSTFADDFLLQFILPALTAIGATSLLGVVRLWNRPVAVNRPTEPRWTTVLAMARRRVAALVPRRRVHLQAGKNFDTR